MRKCYHSFSVDFPLEHVQTGVPVGNGYLGLSVWGQGNIVNVTVGCSALWDHQGGASWQPEQTYENFCTAIENGDKEKMDALFPRKELKPTIIPLARIVLPLEHAERAELSHLDSLVTVYGKSEKTEIRISQTDKGLFAIRGVEEYSLIPSYELAPVLKERSFTPPETIPGGFLQNMPCDPPFGIHAQKSQDGIFFQFFRNRPGVIKTSWAELEEENRSYWSAFWDKVPELSTGDSGIDSFYCHGLFCFQSMTAADGCPAGLQGPWIEDEELPPWSADYHFNINVQMCYWPSCRAGLFENLKPLFAMMESWKETMRRNAKYFAGVDDGYQIAHAVDDRCTGMGGFWAGTVDHACAAWMAIMMYEYYRYSSDRDFLERFGFDFMYGAMRVYEAMLRFDGECCFLPCETSPEFRGAAMDACGRNPSFHLAAIHRLLKDLFQAAELLGRKLPEKWQDIQKKLPLYAECDGEIALWEGLLLPESHRHHSHLAVIYPFDSAPVTDDVKEKSLRRWIELGMGNWAGWSFPWAVMLHNRFGNAEMANFLLDMWPKIYTNKGGRTLHNPRFSGFSVVFGNDRIMQMDAGLGVVAAILDIFLYEEQGILELFHGIPKDGRDFYCKNIAAPGGLRFSGSKDSFSFTASRDTLLKFRFPGTCREWLGSDGRTYMAGDIFQTTLGGGIITFTGGV